MSDDVVEKTLKLMNQQKEHNDLTEKEFFLKKKRVEKQYQDLKDGEKAIEEFKKIDLFSRDEERIKRVLQRQEEYFEGASERIMFIDDLPWFNEVVPFFRKNLILIGAQSGDGKSTCLANIVSGMMQHGKKPFIISNEELEEDICSRVCAITMGLNYANHDKLSSKDKALYRKAVDQLADKYLKIVDNTFDGIKGATTSIEGLGSLLENLYLKYKETGQAYDAILIDYYQRFNTSLANPSLPGWEILGKVSDILEHYRKVYPAPIVLFTQIKPQADEDDDNPFETRIKLGKAIFERATCIIEMRPNKKDLSTQWFVHKNRFNTGSLKTPGITGWERGKYVPYDEEFKRRVAERNMERFKEQQAAEAAKQSKPQGGNNDHKS